MIISNKFYLNKAFDRTSALMPMYEEKLEEMDPIEFIEADYVEKMDWLKEYRRSKKINMPDFLLKKKELDKEKKRRFISLRFLSEASDVDIMSRLSDAREFINEPNTEFGRFAYYFYDPFVRQLIENSLSSNYRHVFNSLCHEFDQAVANFQYRQRGKQPETFEKFVFLKKRNQMVDEVVNENKSLIL
jgi:hypothetical protein